MKNCGLKQMRFTLAFKQTVQKFKSAQKEDFSGFLAEFANTLKTSIPASQKALLNDIFANIPESDTAELRNEMKDDVVTKLFTSITQYNTTFRNMRNFSEAPIETFAYEKSLMASLVDLEKPQISASLAKSFQSEVNMAPVAGTTMPIDEYSTLDDESNKETEGLQIAKEDKLDIESTLNGNEETLTPTEADEASFVLRARAVPKNKPVIGDIAKEVFDNSSYLLEKLASEFQNIFYNELVRLQGENPEGVDEDIAEVINRVKYTLRSRAAGFPPNTRVSEALEDEILEEQLIAVASIRWFDVFKEEYMTGVDFKHVSFDKSQGKYVRSGWGGEGGVTATAQASAMDKMHFNNVPRLKEVLASSLVKRDANGVVKNRHAIPAEDQNKVVLVLDQDKPTLTYEEVKNLCGTINQVTTINSLAEFRYMLKNELPRITKGLSANQISTLLSLKARFIDQDAYKIYSMDDAPVTMNSFSRTMDINNLKTTSNLSKMFNSLYKTMTSVANKEDVKVENNKVVFSKTTVNDISTRIIQDFYNNITDPINKTKIFERISDKIQFLTPQVFPGESEPRHLMDIQIGKFTLHVAKGSIERGSENGSILSVSEDSLVADDSAQGSINNLMDNVKNVRDVLAMLGFDSKLGVNFIESYMQSASLEESFPNLIANIAFMINANTEQGQSFLDRNKIVVDNKKSFTKNAGSDAAVAARNLTDLKYPIFNYVGKFLFPMIEHVDKLYSTDKSAHRLNTAGDMVATQAPIHRFDQFHKLLKTTENSIQEAVDLVERRFPQFDPEEETEAQYNARLEEAKQEAADSIYYNRNAMVNGADGKGAEYKLLQLYSKEGVIKGQIKRGAKEFTHFEQVKYLVENMFLQASYDSGFKEVAMQPGVYSDRSDSLIAKLGLKSYEKQQDALFPIGKNNEIDEGVLQKRLYTSMQREHQAIQMSILRAWNGFLSNRSGKDFNFTTLKDLDAYLSTAKIPNSEVTSDTNLVAQMMYTKKDGYLGIKNMLITMTEEFNNSDADNQSEIIASYLRFEKERFLTDVKNTGYLQDGHELDFKSKNIMSKVMPDATNSKGYGKNMLTAFFYNNNIMANNLLNMVMGNDYLYKGSDYTLADFEPGGKLDYVNAKIEDSEDIIALRKKVPEVFQVKLSVANQKKFDAMPENNAKERKAKKEFKDDLLAKSRIRYKKKIAESEGSANEAMAKYDNAVTARKMNIAIHENLGSMFITKSKRNAALGSGGQAPRLARGSAKEYRNTLSDMVHRNITKAITEGNDGHTLDLTETGEQSALYQSLREVDENGVPRHSHAEAIEIIAKTHTTEFKNWFGNWDLNTVDSAINAQGQPFMVTLPTGEETFTTYSVAELEAFRNDGFDKADMSRFKSVNNKGDFNGSESDLYGNYTLADKELLDYALESGAYLGAHCNTAVIDDPAWYRRIMGSKVTEKIDTYDAAQLAHPLYFITLENSIGNEYSGYATDGGVVKDLTFETNEIDGSCRFQKKATFNIFSNELLKKGSPELWALFTKMNTVPFDQFDDGTPASVEIKVPVLDDYFEETGEYEMRSFNNLYEIWEHFGGLSNDVAWDQISELLGENPIIRESYIQKVGFVSGEKVGNRGVNSPSTIADKSSTITFTPMKNDNHEVILNSYHNPDTTLNFDETAHQHSNEVSLMTQAVGAAMFEGNSYDNADNINDTLFNVSNSNIESRKDLIKRDSISELKTMYQTEINEHIKPGEDMTDEVKQAINESLTAKGLPDLDTLINLTEKFVLDEQEEAQLTEILETTGIFDRQVEAYIRKISTDALTEREAYGVNASLLKDSESFLGIKQVMSSVHSNLMAEMTKKTVRIKFAGGQYVVSPSYDLIKMYILPNGNRVNSTSYQGLCLKHFPETHIKLRDLNGYNQVLLPHQIKVEGEIKTKWEFQREEKNRFANLQRAGVIGPEIVFDQYLNDRFAELDVSYVPLKQEAKEIYEGPNGKAKDEIIGDPNTLQWNTWTNNKGEKTVDIEEYKTLLLAGESKTMKQFLNQYIKGKEFDLGKSSIDMILAAHPEIPEYIRDAVKESSTGEQPIYNPEKEVYYENDIDTKKFILVLKRRLEDRMNDASEEWKHESNCEVFLPMLHKTSYGLRFDDELSDILGAHISRDSYKTDEDYEDALLNHRYAWFQRRVASKNTMARTLKLKRNMDLNDEKTVKSFVKKVKRMYDNLPIGSSMSADLETILNAIKVDPETGNVIENNLTNEIVDNARNNVINAIAHIQAVDFPKSIEVITGRIPGQGKQSYTSATIVGFVSSSQNASYAPVEQNMVTGQDHDIDKTNIMAFSVNAIGQLYDYKPYLKFTGKGDPKTQAFDIKNYKIDYTKYHDLLNSAIESYLSSMPEDTTEKDKNDKIASITAKHHDTFQNASKNYILDNLLATSKEPKNAVEAGTPMDMGKLHGMKDEMNAFIKASRMTDGTYLGAEVASPYNPFSIPAYEIENQVGKAAVGVFAAAIKTYSALYTTWMKAIDTKELEFPSNFSNIKNIVNAINIDKKLDIDPAEATKKVEDAYKRWLDNNPKIETSESDEDYYSNRLSNFDQGVEYSTDKTMFGEVETVNHKINRNAMTLHLTYNALDENNQPTVVRKAIRKTTLSNTQKHISERARQMLQGAKSESYENTVLNYYTELTEGALPENQAWLDLSILISAATDNAKELILDKIGANSITNGMISTMIMIGFDVRDVVKFVKSPKIQALVDEVKAGQNIEIKDNDVFKSLSSLIKQKKRERGYQSTRARLESDIITKSMNEDYATDPRLKADLDKDLQEYYFDDYAELEKFDKAAKEIRVISGVLSINQSIPKSVYDVMTYLNNVNNGINKMYKDNGMPPKYKYDPDHPNDGHVKFDIFDFIGDARVREFHIKKFDTIKTAFNIPLIISKNDHFFGYLQGLKFGYESFRGVTSIYDSLNLVQDKMISNGLIDSEAGFSKDQFDDVVEFSYGLQISEFFKDSEVKNQGNFKIRNKDYKLSRASDRNQFLKDIVELVKDIKRLPEDNSKLRNKFLESFSISTGEDPVTGDTVNFLKTINLQTADATTEAIMQMDYRKLKQQDPELAQALFYYTLITEKGARSKRSFAQIIDAETFQQYSRFCKKLIEEKGRLEQIHDMPIEAVVLSCTSLMPTYSTAYKKPRMSQEEAEMYREQMQQMAEEGVSSFERSPNSKKESFHFDTAIKSIDRKIEKYNEAVKEGRSLEKGESDLAIFRSIETGRIYQVFKDAKGEKHAIEITPKYSMNSIPYNTTGIASEREKRDMGAIRPTGLVNAGYQIGRSIFVAEDVKGVVVDYEEQTGKYIILSPVDGRMVLSKKLLESLNPNLVFDRKYVGKKSASEKIDGGQANSVNTSNPFILVAPGENSMESPWTTKKIKGETVDVKPDSLNTEQKDWIKKRINSKTSFNLVRGRKAYINKLLYNYLNIEAPGQYRYLTGSDIIEYVGDEEDKAIVPTSLFANNVTYGKNVNNPNLVYKKSLFKEWFTKEKIWDGDTKLSKLNDDLRLELIEDPIAAEGLTNEDPTLKDIFLHIGNDNNAYPKIIEILNKHKVRVYKENRDLIVVTDTDLLDTMKHIIPSVSGYDEAQIKERANIFFMSGVYSFSGFVNEYYKDAILNEAQKVNLKRIYAEELAKVFSEENEEVAKRTIRTSSSNTERYYAVRRDEANKLALENWKSVDKIEKDKRESKTYRTSFRIPLSKNAITEGFTMYTRDINGVNAHAINAAHAHGIEFNESQDSNVDYRIEKYGDKIIKPALKSMGYGTSVKDVTHAAKLLDGIIKSNTVVFMGNLKEGGSVLENKTTIKFPGFEGDLGLALNLAKAWYHLNGNSKAGKAKDMYVYDTNDKTWKWYYQNKVTPIVKDIDLPVLTKNSMVLGEDLSDNTVENKRFTDEVVTDIDKLFERSYKAASVDPSNKKASIVLLTKELLDIKDRLYNEGITSADDRLTWLNDELERLMNEPATNPKHQLIKIEAVKFAVNSFSDTTEETRTDMAKGKSKIPTFGAISTYSDEAFNFSESDLEQVADLLESDNKDYYSESNANISMDEFLASQAPDISIDDITKNGLAQDVIDNETKKKTKAKSKTIRFTGDKFNLKSMEVDDIFVFGANRAGEHGKGAAGSAMGVQRSAAVIKKVKDGTKGKFAVKGKTGYQVGTEGEGFGLITVEELIPGKKSVRATEETITNQLEYLMKHAEANPSKTYIFSYNKPGTSLNGYNLDQMADMFIDAAKIFGKKVPSNIVFGDKFQELLVFKYKTKNIEADAKEETTYEEDVFKSLDEMLDPKYSLGAVDFELGPITAPVRLKSERAGKKVMNFIYDKISNLYPEIDVQPISSAEIEIVYGKSFADKSGFVIDGKVVINTDQATLDTPMHEFGGHIYMKYLKQAEPEVYNSVIRKCLYHPLATEIRNTYTWVKSDEGIGEEVFATLLGLQAQGDVNKAYVLENKKVMEPLNNAKKGFFSWLRDLFRGVFGTRKIDTNITATDTLKTVMRKITSDILYNEGTMLNTLIQDGKEVQMLGKDRIKTINDHMTKEEFNIALKTNMTFDDIRTSLEEQGFIKYLCD